MSDKHRLHAIGRTTVKTYEADGLRRGVGGVDPERSPVTEAFSGDIEGEVEFRLGLGAAQKLVVSAGGERRGKAFARAAIAGRPR
jgi:hypothetical protein